MSAASRIWAASWRILAFLIVWGALSAAAIVPIGGRDQALQPGVRQLYYDVASLLTIALAAWAATRCFDRRPFRTLGFSSRAAGDVVFGLIVAAGMGVASVSLLMPPGWMAIEAQSPSAWSLIVVLLSIAANAAAQEVMFQGYVLQTIAARFSTAIAVAVTAVLFTAAHAGVFTAGSALPPLNLLSAGLLLAISYTTTGHLWLPIGLHFGWNAVQTTVLGLSVSGQDVYSSGAVMRTTLAGPAWLTGGPFGLEGGVAGTAVTAAAIVAVLLRATYKPPPVAMADTSAS